MTPAACASLLTKTIVATIGSKMVAKNSAVFAKNEFEEYEFRIILVFFMNKQNADYYNSLILEVNENHLKLCL